MSTTPDYKDTIRLPKTDFPMKGDLPIREPKMLQTWEEKGIYTRLIERNSKKPSFTLPDGPPYANGAIHIGHALNKVLKDIIIKYKNMSGFCAPMVPGWDCHGLPIEHKVMKDLNDKKIVKTDQEILGLCRAEAQKWIDEQAKQFKRLGVIADWKHPYRTLDASYEAEEVREFARAYKKNLIYRGEKPVYWNWVLKTALADAEVEYHQHKSPSIYVKFNVRDEATLKKLGSPSKPTSFVIWTTTPWTLPANLGVCLHPDFDYTVFDSGSENLVIATALKEFVEKDTGVSLTPGFQFKGQTLELSKARHPWIDRDSVIVLGQHVTQDAGTGCVHTAPGHGADDYKVGTKYGMPILCPVDESGLYTDEVPEYKGINIFKANPLIVERLKTSGYLISFKEFEHSYPHCWRSKVPLIFRATAQWFLGIDLEHNPLRKKILKELDSVKFFPSWGESRFRSMMENRPDWCLSRQRIWGVPIPILTCVATGESVADFDVMMRAADVIEKNGGIEAYHKTSAEDLVGPFKDQVLKSMKSELESRAAAAVSEKRVELSKTLLEKIQLLGSQGFKHGKDILDVWFDSGVCHAAVLKLRPPMTQVADIYLEGSDQHRGWFNTSMLTSMATTDRPPFKALLTHGFVTDPQGRKMSKSLGNVVDPNEVSAKSGSEIIRLWAAYEDYGQDVSCGPEELTRVTETYRRIRNTMRFLLGALADFDFSKDAVEYSMMTQIDQWALHQLYELNQKVTQAYETYEFYKVYHALNNFYTVTLSAIYLDVLKDRLYTWKHNGVPRRSSQTVLYMMTDSLIRMMAPILSFLAEECYGHLPAAKKEDSVFFLDFPKAQVQWKNESLHQIFESVLKVRSDVQKELEGLRAQKTIGASLEAEVAISAEAEAMTALKAVHDLRELLIVSKVSVVNGPYKIQVRKADGEKCVRCWVYSTEISKESQFLGICPKCVEALK